MHIYIYIYTGEGPSGSIWLRRDESIYLFLNYLNYLNSRAHLRIQLIQIIHIPGLNYLNYLNSRAHLRIQIIQIIQIIEITDFNYLKYLNSQMGPEQRSDHWFELFELLEFTDPLENSNY